MSNQSIVQAIEKHKWTNDSKGVFDDILQDELDKKTDHYINLRNQFEKEQAKAGAQLFTAPRDVQNRRLKHINRLGDAIQIEWNNIQDLLQKRYISPQGPQQKRNFFDVRRNALAPAGARWSKRNYTWRRNFNFKRYH